MQPVDRRRLELVSGTPVANAVAEGIEAFERGRLPQGDAEFHRAVQLAEADSLPWTDLALEHVGRLWNMNHHTPALRRCHEYLERSPDEASLLVLCAEIHISVGDATGARVHVDRVHVDRLRVDRVHVDRVRANAGSARSLTRDEDARLYRVQGVLAGYREAYEEAANHLAEARRLFDGLGNQPGVDLVDTDLVRNSIWRGDESAASKVLSGPKPRTVADHLLHASAYKLLQRYEEALTPLERLLATVLDPAQRMQVLSQIVVLRRLLRRDDAAVLRPALEQAAELSPDPQASVAAMAGLFDPRPPERFELARFGQGVQHARRLMSNVMRLGEAAKLLDDLRERRRTDADFAWWHLAAGELRFAQGGESPTAGPLLDDAMAHLRVAIRRASVPTLVECRVLALRILGRIHSAIGDDDRAVQCWAEVDRLERHIAVRQVTDRSRVRMLQAVPDEHDERIAAAVRAMDKRGDEAAAAVVIAMEAARGAMVLESAFPGYAHLTRDLPKPTDIDAAWRWVARLGHGLPRTQVAWLMHSSPELVHHAIVGRGLLHCVSVPARRDHLTNAVDALMRCWRNSDDLLVSVATGAFDERLDDVAALVRVSDLVRALPPGVRRIAMVAGGALSDIPFAAMTISGENRRLGLEYALSDLPCLSIKLPLDRRSRRLRSDRLLLVSPPDDKLTPSAMTRVTASLAGAYATKEGLQDALRRHRRGKVRIDSHGHHAPDDATMSWLRLAPAGRAGSLSTQELEPTEHLTAEELKSMSLQGCGTLVLGACESGMAQRVGRDERMGFVRAAFNAGAASVVAARWEAQDFVARSVLDRFDAYVHYLPRDVALQRAQLDVYESASDVSTDAFDVDHPAFWACWTLYGDSGWQTGAGPVRRSLRLRRARRGDAGRTSSFDEWRRVASG